MTFRRILVAILFVALLPLGASAQTVDGIAQQIETLQKRIAELQEQLRQIETVSQSSPTHVPASASSACVAPTRDLSLRDTDARTNNEVSILQRFLARDSAIYPDALVTGFFGHLTEAAVKRYQKSKGILQTGFVGPLTRTAIRKDCGEGGAVGTTPYSFGAWPTVGDAPLTVKFTATAAETRETGVWYSVDFGDGTQGNMSASASDGALSVSHTYASGGTFSAKLLQNEDVCGIGQTYTYTYGCTRQLIVDSATVTVATSPTPPAPPPSPTPSLTPTGGACLYKGSSYMHGSTVFAACPNVNDACHVAVNSYHQCQSGTWVGTQAPSTTSGSCRTNNAVYGNGQTVSLSNCDYNCISTPSACPSTACSERVPHMCQNGKWVPPTQTTGGSCIAYGKTYASGYVERNNFCSDSFRDGCLAAPLMWPPWTCSNGQWCGQTGACHSSFPVSPTVTGGSCKTGKGESIPSGGVLDYCQMAHGIGINCLVAVNPKYVCSNSQWIPQ
ncbi:hypothetical protein A2851_00205 [Candidatus Kaiserbacteria bacterium RIFCSPHIGHO2_01_FULL_53_29]|uniref:PKD domain-containing protein n=1 Tax=Candidatus Kaiserbacteria bacterium RIFCSPHIGHO2_01_FULL_53_29 TaxID=1798480 RepID=A0A1F6CWA4_9BACT|nr:MAG: hypothetical protein A2851_00205 [Candidatus Kaiserbacteria bacterium RIFCSPHIGHO2_01_FULL_53_29]